jgi:dienelactone hydrolase
MKRLMMCMLVLMFGIAACETTPTRTNGESTPEPESATETDDPAPEPQPQPQPEPQPEPTPQPQPQPQPQVHPQPQVQPQPQPQPEPEVIPATPIEPAPSRAEQTITLTTEDGVELKGTLYRPEGRIRAAVVCLPMKGATRESFKPVARLLVQRGVVVLALDLRGHGDSGTAADAANVEQDDAEVFRAMQADVIEAVRALREGYGVGADPVGLLGAGTGAAVAALYAAGNEDIRGLALLSPGDFAGMRPSAQANNIKARVLITTEDENASDPIYTALFAAGAGIPEYHQDCLRDPTRRITHHGTDQFNKEYGIETRLADFFEHTLR